MSVSRHRDSCPPAGAHSVPAPLCAERSQVFGTFTPCTGTLWAWKAQWALLNFYRGSDFRQSSTGPFLLSVVWRLLPTGPGHGSPLVTKLSSGATVGIQTQGPKWQTAQADATCNCWYLVMTQELFIFPRSGLLSCVCVGFSSFYATFIQFFWFLTVHFVLFKPKGKGQRTILRSLFSLPHVSLGSNLGHQPWWQAPLITELSCWPLNLLL